MASQRITPEERERQAALLAQARASAQGFRYKSDWRNANPKIYRQLVRAGLTRHPDLDQLFITYDDRGHRPGARPDRAGEITQRVDMERAREADLFPVSARQRPSAGWHETGLCHQDRNFRAIVAAELQRFRTFEQFERANPKLYARARGAGLLDDPDMTGHLKMNTPAARRLSMPVAQLIASAAGHPTLADWRAGDLQAFTAAFRQGLLTDPDITGHMVSARKDIARLLWPRIEEAVVDAGSFEQVERDRPELLRMARDLGLTSSERMIGLMTGRERQLTISQARPELALALAQSGLLNELLANDAASSEPVRIGIAFRGVLEMAERMQHELDEDWDQLEFAEENLDFLDKFEM